MLEVGNALNSLENDDSVGAIIITGSEKAFAAGADIKEMQNNTYSQCMSGNFLAHWNRVAESVKPILAAVNGYAVSIRTTCIIAANEFYCSWAVVANWR